MRLIILSSLGKALKERSTVLPYLSTRILYHTYLDTLASLHALITPK